MSKQTNVAGIVAGVVGGFMLLVSFLLLHFILFLSVLLGVAGYIGTFLILSALKPKVEMELKFNEVTPEILEATLKDGREKIKSLESYATMIKDQSVIKKVNHIIEVINRIFENFKKDPKDIKVARQFLSYYFDATLRIVNMYVDLSSQKIRTPEIAATLLKAENMLNSIALAYEKLLTKLLEDDIMNLDVEIETLEKTFRAENLK